jgi:hypothetical protein
MENLQTHFLEVVQENLEFGKPLKDLDHHYVQLSRDVDTMAESIALYKGKEGQPKSQQGDLQEVSLTEIVKPTQGEAGVLPLPPVPH